MISIWEKESLLSYDVIIVGAGITGLSTAASIKEKSPNRSVLVLEKGVLPTGASTRNAGFACFGSVSELLEDQKELGNDGMCNLVEKRLKGLNKTRERLGDQSIGFEPVGGYELIRLNDSFNPESLKELNNELESITGAETFSFQNSKIEEFGFKKVDHLVFNQYEGALHTGKLINSLWNYCCRLGIKIITGTEVLSVTSEGNKALIRTPEYSFEGKAVGICTNAFSKKIIENIDLIPGRGMVLLIKPDKPISFKGTFHYDHGYYYFRDFQQKLIFGGGRNLEFKKETTLEFGINEKIQERLESDLKEFILPDQSYTIEMSWSGIMGFGESKEPIIKQIDQHTFMGIRLGGMGVAIGSLVGEDLASLILRSCF